VTRRLISEAESGYSRVVALADEIIE